MEAYNYDEELDRQRNLNEVYTKDKVVLIRMITFFNNVEAKYDFDYCIRKCKKHRQFYINYKEKLKAFGKDKTIY